MNARDREFRDSLAGSGVDAGVVGDASSPTVLMVLALVLEQPSHGYEIYRRYELRFDRFLPVSRTRLYAILSRLENAGMIESVVLEQVRKQHDLRKSYRATRRGAEEFRRWLAGLMMDDSNRLELFGRIASLGFLGVDAMLGVVDQYESNCMRTMKGLATSDPEDGHDNIAELIDSLILDQQRREMRARIDWAIHARQMLKAYESRLNAERAASHESAFDQ